MVLGSVPTSRLELAGFSSDTTTDVGTADAGFSLGTDDDDAPATSQQQQLGWSVDDDGRPMLHGHSSVRGAYTVVVEHEPGARLVHGEGRTQSTAVG